PERADGEQIFFFTMEYLEGETLDHRLKAGPVATDQTIQFAAAIAEGLAAAHEQNVIHCDLKPANIMLTSGRGGAERIVIMDFGLAAPVDSAIQSSLGEVIGSP